MSDIKVKDEIVVNKTGVWYFAAEILKKYGMKKSTLVQSENTLNF